MDEKDQILEEIIHLIRNGDEHAFSLLHKECQKPLYYFTYKLVEDSKTAEDIVSETFAKAWFLRQNFKTLSDIRGFLYVSARNGAYDYLRSKKRRQEALLDDIQEVQEDGSVNALNLLIQTELLFDIYREIENLPPQQRTIISLFYLQDLNISEISEKLNIIPETVRNTKSIALKVLRSKILKKIIPFVLALLHII